jgi:hypothetical protein
MKEFFVTVLAFALGFVIGTIVLSKLPTKLGGGSTWEESV